MVAHMVLNHFKNSNMGILAHDLETNQGGRLPIGGIIIIGAISGTIIHRVVTGDWWWSEMPIAKKISDILNADAIDRYSNPFPQFKYFTRRKNS
jgi:hypothetical protein